MQVHGLTGGIGSGKSTVSKMLVEMGVPVLDADHYARVVVAPGSIGLAQIAETFGEDVLDSSGALDRPKLGAIVFSDTSKRRALEAIIHPKVRAAMAEAISEYEAAGEPIAFMDIPLLFESRNPDDFASVTVVHVSPEIQIQRVMARDGLSKEAVQARIDAQMPIDKKAEMATCVIDNSQDLAHTKAQVESLVARLIG